MLTVFGPVDEIMTLLCVLCFGFFLGSACIYIAFSSKRKAAQIIKRLRDAQTATYPHPVAAAPQDEDYVEYLRRTRV